MILSIIALAAAVAPPPPPRSRPTFLPPKMHVAGQLPDLSMDRSTRCELRLGDVDWRGQCLLKKREPFAQTTDRSMRIYAADGERFPNGLTELHIAIMRPGFALLTGYSGDGKQVWKTTLTHPKDEPTCWQGEDHRICVN